MNLSQKRQEVEQGLINRADADESFRRQLLSKPKAAISEAIHLEFNDGVKVLVHEETATELHLVLPISLGVNELSDVDLESVAGGVASFDPNAGSNIATPTIGTIGSVSGGISGVQSGSVSTGTPTSTAIVIDPNTLSQSVFSAGGTAASKAALYAIAPPAPQKIIPILSSGQTTAAIGPNTVQHPALNITNTGTSGK